LDNSAVTIFLFNAALSNHSQWPSDDCAIKQPIFAKMLSPLQVIKTGWSTTLVMGGIATDHEMHDSKEETSITLLGLKWKFLWRSLILLQTAPLTNDDLSLRLLLDWSAGCCIHLQSLMYGSMFVLLFCRTHFVHCILVSLQICQRRQRFITSIQIV
jgi:hypothetical protein